jgi:hypothetical protein
MNRPRDLLARRLRLIPMQPDREAQLGSIGIGRGGCGSPPRRPSTSMQVSTQIRHAAALIRGRVSVDDLTP